MNKAVVYFLVTVAVGVVTPIVISIMMNDKEDK